MDQRLMDKEPVVTVAMVTGIGSAFVACLVAFGLPLNNNQQGAVLGLLAVVAPLVVMVARKWAWAPKSVRRAVADACEPVVQGRRHEEPSVEDWAWPKTSIGGPDMPEAAERLAPPTDTIGRP